jgi:hypothetical protein
MTGTIRIPFIHDGLRSACRSRGLTGSVHYKIAFLSAAFGSPFLFSERATIGLESTPCNRLSTPAPAVKAHLAVQAHRMLPVHWGTFNIAFHDWDEPIKRAVKAANEKDVDLVTPRVGEVVIASEPFNSESWWEEVR